MISTDTRLAASPAPQQLTTFKSGKKKNKTKNRVMEGGTVETLADSTKEKKKNGSVGEEQNDGEGFMHWGSL